MMTREFVSTEGQKGYAYRIPSGPFSARFGTNREETFLEAHRHFPLFQGRTAAEFVHWLRQILAARLAKLVRRYLGTKGRNVRLEQELERELARSSQAFGRALVAGQSTPSQQAV